MLLAAIGLNLRLTPAILNVRIWILSVRILILSVRMLFSQRENL